MNFHRNFFEFHAAGTSTGKRMPSESCLTAAQQGEELTSFTTLFAQFDIPLGREKPSFGVSLFRKGSMNERSRSGWVITAVCDVAGKTAKREAGSGLPISPMTPPPSNRNIETECSSVATSASPLMISTGVLSALTSPSHAMGSCSSAISFLTRAGNPLGSAASLRYSFANDMPTNISTDICGMKALNSACQPSAS
jgi:hypothetical protein